MTQTLYKVPGVKPRLIKTGDRGRILTGCPQHPVGGPCRVSSILKPGEDLVVEIEDGPTILIRKDSRFLEFPAGGIVAA